MATPASLSHRSTLPVTCHRIVVKAGTAVVTGGGEALDPVLMASLVGQIARLHEEGREVLLVSSGAIAAGRHVLGLQEERRDVPYRQVLAAVGQSRLMHSYEELFAHHGLPVAQALLTRGDIAEHQGYLNVRDTLLGLLKLRVVPIINENDVVAAEEIGEEAFGDNDTLSALVANLVEADLLVMLTDTSGLYTADPAVDSSARIIAQVDRIDDFITSVAAREQRHAWSRGGMATKLEAARLATGWGVAVVIAGGGEADVLLDVVAGRERGTFFPPSASKMESRRRWLLSGLSTRGKIRVDDGAIRALGRQHGSLLPVGVQGVEGEFERHDVVLIVDGQGRGVACGVSNYGAREINAIKGLHSRRIAEVLGHQYGEEVVHRNNLALLHEAAGV